MTVGEMREIMRRRVVPEDIVPQNVIGLLIDDEENAAPPELDAFTFLTRLRGLGIGSADFLYLLEGCEAPQPVIDKIKNNPAMNLQGLILTLESSGLTSDDYSRILYTARQIWERTLTLRLEKSEMVLQGDDEEEDYSEPTFEEVMGDLEHIGEQPAAEAPKDVPEEIAEEAPQEFIEEAEKTIFTVELAPPIAVPDFVDKTVTEENAPQGEVIEEPQESEYAPEYDEKPAPGLVSVSANTEELFAEGGFDEAEEAEQEYEPDEDAGETDTEEFAEEYDEVSEDYTEEHPVFTEEIEPISQPYNGDTTMIVQIDQEMLRKNLERLAEEEEAERHAEEAKAAAAKAAAEKAQREAREAYEAARAEEAEQSDDEETEPDDYDEPEERPVRTVRTARQAPFTVSVPNYHPYHKGAIIAAAVGAVVVFGASVGVQFIPEVTAKAEIKGVDFAEDSMAVFSQIYYAYNDKISGGGNAVEGVYDYNKIFGDLLVRADGFGTFSEGDNVYTVTMEAVEAKAFKNGGLTSLGEILPPGGTRIVNAFEDNNALIAVFTGKAECGFMKISGGTALYTVTQDGFMTDFDYKDGDILIGSVYKPNFSRTFEVVDEDVYLPRVGTEKQPMSPQSVILSGTRGFSYAVSAAYSTADGSVKSSRAAIGDPVSASADGRYIMSGTSVAVDKDGNRTENGVMISVGEEVSAVSTDVIKAAAFFENGCATYENGVINIRDDKYEAVAQLINLAQPVTSMRFDGSLLLVNGESGTFLVRDCSNLKEPAEVVLKSVDGAVYGDNALVYGTGANSMTISHYRLENGSASLVNTLTKTMDIDQLNTLEFGGVNTVIMDGVRFGAAYRYFDGVSVMSGYAVMSDNGEESPSKELFDDRTGFTLAFKHGGTIYALCGGGIVDILN